MYGDQKVKDLKDSKVSAPVLLDSAKSLEDFQILIGKQIEADEKINPFEILDKINKAGLTPDISIYNSLLNFCYTKGKYEEAGKLYEEVFDYASPVQPDLSSFNILLKGISIKLENVGQNQEEKVKLLDAAEKVFEDLQERYNYKPNDVTINTKMDILIKGGQINKAWDLFDIMKTKYLVEPDKYSYSTIIKALKYEPDLSKLDRTFGILTLLKEKKVCSSNDEIIFNCLIDVCVKLQRIEKAEMVFRTMKEYNIQPTKITYAVMIRGYGQIYQIDKAFELFEEMKFLGIEANDVVFGCMLNACIRSSNIKKVSKLYEEMQEKQIKMNIILYTTLIKAYSKGKNFTPALKIYEAMLVDPNIKPNIIVHNAMLDCCVECICIHKMNEIYERVKKNFLEAEDNSDCPKPDLITYSTVIKGYSKAKDMDKVFDIYNFLLNSKEFHLDEVIYNSVLDGCAKTNSFDKAMEVYNTMNKNKVNKSNVTYSILVKIFSNNRQEDKAISLLAEMKLSNIKPGLIVYTCLIQTCLKSKRFNDAIELFEDCKFQGLKPHYVLYNTIVNGSIYSQKLEIACKYTIESFSKNVRMADDIYVTILEKLVSNYCKLKSFLKAEYAQKIVQLLKERGFDIKYEIYSEVAKMIYKIQGVQINDLKSSKNEKSNEDWTKKTNLERKKEVNKDQLVNIRKNFN